jgi:hypothetical protein
MLTKIHKNHIHLFLNHAKILGCYTCQPHSRCVVCMGGYSDLCIPHEQDIQVIIRITILGSVNGSYHLSQTVNFVQENDHQ